MNRIKFIVGLSMIAAVMFMYCAQQPSRTFYIDADNGSDNNSGLSAASAWQTIERLNQHDLQPSDRILFFGGQHHRGRIVLDSLDCGTKEYPIIFSSFGGKKADIHTEHTSGILLQKTAHLIFAYLEVTGSGRFSNTASGIVLDQCHDIHIDSVRVSGFQKAGIDILDSPDIKVTRVHAFDNGAAGIQSQSPEKLNKNLYIGYCLADNNPGDPTNMDNHSGNGIVVSGVDIGLIEYCAATNNGWDMPRDGNGPVGIWAWHSNRVVIQHCISFANKTSPNGKDGGGFDFDGGVTNSIMQYNLSYDNEGAGYGLYQYAGASEWANNCIRYNISYNDGWKNGQCGIHVWASPGDETNMHSASIYNNTIVNPDYAVAFLVQEPVRNFEFSNNIFYADEQVHGLFSNSMFTHNCYWSDKGKGFHVESFSSLESWLFSTQASMADQVCGNMAIDPQLDIPERLLITNPSELKTLEYFKTKETSPCRSAGRILPGHAVLDFWGAAIPNISPDIGAFQHIVP